MSLSNSQYEAIMRQYELIRDKNRRLLQSRRDEIYQKIPRIRELDNRIASVSVSQAKLLLSGDEEALTRLHTSLADITYEKKTLLTDAGYPSHYLDPVYSCPDCMDTGYLTSKEGRKSKCHCFREQETLYLYEQSNIRENLLNENFSTLSYDYYAGEDLKHFTKAVQICYHFIDTFHQDYHNILFYGTVGTGKSFLSGCIANELLQRQCSVLYFSSSALFDLLAFHTFDTKNRQELSELNADIYQCDLFIIDDLGTETSNSFVNSQLFVCLNERHLRKKATIISTNLNLKELQGRYSDRVFSRLSCNFDLCKLTGKDIRIQKKLGTVEKY